MNRNQFWILNALSGVVVLLFATQIFLVHQAIYEQGQMAMAQQALQQGQAFQNNLKSLATRIVQVSQANGGDQQLKDLLTRQQIQFTPQGQEGTTPASTR